MNGKPSTHVASAFNSMDNARLSRALKNMLHDLLVHQFVVGPGRQNYQVTEESGQGQIASGEISDNVFCDMAETYAATARVMREHGIEGYYRYRDDILLIAEHGPRVAAYFSHVKRLCSGTYEIICDKVSKHEVDFLDLFFL